MPSSSLVEMKVDVWVGVEVGVGFEVGVRVWVWVKIDAVQFSYFFGQVGGRRNGD